MKTHLDTPGQPLTLKRTGQLVPFLSISFGQPFWAHGRIWVRTAYDAATELTSTRTDKQPIRPSTCNFDIDEIDRLVEAVSYENSA